jgi:hypothetical protein
VRYLTAVAALVLSAAALAGCSSSPVPEGASPPPAARAVTSEVVSGAPDTSGSVPGSANALYVFRFKQSEPSSALFNFRDRDLSFYFRPSPSALYFRVENLQGRPVQIDWDHSVFYDVNGRATKPAHGNTRWKDRFAPLVYTQIGGQQQFGDYLFPMDYLVDPGASADTQPHLPIVPEDASAPTYSGRTFGVDLVFMIEDRPRTYPFRFQVASVIPR